MRRTKYYSTRVVCRDDKRLCGEHAFRVVIDDVGTYVVGPIGISKVYPVFRGDEAVRLYLKERGASLLAIVENL